MIRRRKKTMGDRDRPLVVPSEKKGSEGGGKRCVGLKYCGGCNPRYDRIALAEALMARLGPEIEWVSPDAGQLDFVLAIEGCQTACADLSPFEGMEIRVITCPEEADGFIRDMEGPEGEQESADRPGQKSGRSYPGVSA
jgi:hypothetical protein